MNEETLTLEEQHAWEKHSLQETGDSMEGDSGREEGGNVLAEEDDENETVSLVQENEGDQSEEPMQAPPDPQKDFMGYLQWIGQMLQNKQQTSEVQQTGSEGQESSEAERLQSFFHQSVETVKKTHRDFNKAADFVY
ncbi:MAG: hypothetical protein PV353_06880, partial [Bartonella sp.]|nr:hypothetical protein [Bartonella sp.]